MSKTPYQYINLVGKNLHSRVAELKQTKVDYPVLTVEGETVVNVKYPYGDIRRYGAVCDGVTDDSTAFKNAITCNSEVILPEGTTYINSVIPYNTSDVDGLRNGIIGKNNLTIKGAGIDKSIILAGPGVTVYLSPLMFVNCNNLYLHDFTVDGNKEVVIGDIYDQIRNIIIRGSKGVLVERCAMRHSWGTGISFSELTDFTVRDCDFTNIDSGINSAGSGITKHMLVENCVFDGHSKSEPIVLEHGEDLVVRKCRIDNKQDSNGIWIGRVNGVLIEDTTFENCACGIMMTRVVIVENTNDVVDTPTDIVLRRNSFSLCDKAFKVRGVINLKTYDNTFYRSPIRITELKSVYKSYRDKFITYSDSDYAKVRAIRFENNDGLASSDYDFSAQECILEEPTFDNSEGVSGTYMIYLQTSGYLNTLIVKDPIVTACVVYDASVTNLVSNFYDASSVGLASVDDAKLGAQSVINAVWGGLNNG